MNNMMRSELRKSDGFDGGGGCGGGRGRVKAGEGRPSLLLRQPMVLPLPSPDGSPLYEVTVAWRYRWVDDRTGRAFRLTVPAGFILDGTSVPRWLWSVTGITPDGLERAASTAHDYLYRYRGVLPKGRCQEMVCGCWTDRREAWTRVEADALFARILKECGVALWRGRLMHAGVRLFGWRSWRPVWRNKEEIR